MTIKATKPVPPHAATTAAEADVDAFVIRHRDELNESIRRSRADVASGIQSTRTIDDIITDGRKRHRAG